jgi:hypothetical protein
MFDVSDKDNYECVTKFSPATTTQTLPPQSDPASPTQPTPPQPQTN